MMVIWVFFCGAGVRSRSYGRTAALRLIVQPCDEDEEKDDQFFSFFQVMEHQWNEIDRGKPKYSGKNLSSATLSTTNPTLNNPRSNPGLRGGRPATNRLSHGKVRIRFYQNVLVCSKVIAEGGGSHGPSNTTPWESHSTFRSNSEDTYIQILNTK
jgi:hypothetical protein